MLPIKKDFLIRLVGAGCLFGLFVWSSPDFIRINTFSAVVLITLPITLVKQNNGEKENLWWIVLLFILFNLLIPTKTGAFGALILVTLYFTGYHRIRLRLPVMAHLALITPLFGYITNMISFPMRINLSQLAVKVLDLFGTASSAGNVIYLDGREYLVDQACAGLFMLEYGVLFGTLIINWASGNNPNSLLKSGVLYLLLLMMILFSNLIRIIVLVYSHILPENWLHEVIGLALFAELVLLPFYLLVTRWKSAQIAPSTLSPNSPPIGRLATIWMLFVLLTIRLYLNSSDQPQTVKMEIPGYESTLLSSGVSQLQNDQSLIYIKPPVSAYKSDHNPMICWKGSGFDFKKIDQLMIDELTVNYAELQREDEKLFSAWWFESKETRTSDQWTWRSKTLMDQEQFYLINVTCSTRPVLEEQLIELMRKQSTLSNL